MPAGAFGKALSGQTARALVPVARYPLGSELPNRYPIWLDRVLDPATNDLDLSSTVRVWLMARGT